MDWQVFLRDILTLRLKNYILINVNFQLKLFNFNVKTQKFVHFLQNFQKYEPMSTYLQTAKK